MTPREVEDYFWARVTGGGVDECWIWIGRRTRGYGRPILNGQGWLAHRWTYEQLIGPIPDGLELDHLCRKPACVNPWHLDPVTHAVNMARGASAIKTECVNGHAYDEQNTAYRRGRGGRYCKRCNADRAAAIFRKRSEVAAA